MLILNDLIKRDGLWYEKFTNELFTGNSTGLKQGKVKDGKKMVNGFII